jgi:DNA-binding transcriptional regulator YhcF (GntR family)
MSGWIKIHRKFLEWEWFNKSEAVHLFMYMLLKANHKDGKWQGIEIKRGQFISSLGNISNATGISVQTIRTILKKLEKTNEIELKSTSQFTIVTICKYECYQDENDDTNKQLTNNQQTTNKQLTTNKNEKNEKNNKYSFLASLLEHGFDEKLSLEWMEVRKQLKAVNTETAFNSFISQVQKHGGDRNHILRKCVERSWKGFNHTWLEKENDTLLNALNGIR